MSPCTETARLLERALGDVKLVGGAGIVLQRIGNRPTADIDASYSDPHTIHAVPDNATWVELEQLAWFDVGTRC